MLELTPSDFQATLLEAKPVPLSGETDDTKAVPDSESEDDNAAKTATESEDATVTKAVGQPKETSAVPDVVDIGSELNPLPDNTPAKVSSNKPAIAISSELRPTDESNADPDNKESICSTDHSKIVEAKPLIPEVRRVDFEHFKNRYLEDEGRYVLEALEAGANLVHEIRRLHTLRNWHSKRTNVEKRKAVIAAVAAPSVGGKVEQTWIQRVRIQSPGVILHLANIVGETWPTSNPRTFFRPFRVLIYFQPRMKEILTKLEARWKLKEEIEPTQVKRKDANDSDPKIGIEASAAEGSPEANEIGAEDDDFNNKAAQNPTMYDIETLKAMRCYVNFVDTEIMHLYTMFKDPTRTKVRFEDLWLLFRVGELVYASLTSDVRPRCGHDGNSDSGLPQSTLAWRVYTLNSPNDYRGYSSIETLRKPRAPDDDGEEDPDELSNTSSAFQVWCYYIDFDGFSYGPVKHLFLIPRFEGEMDIRMLPCYPVRYAEDPELFQTLEHEKQEGVKFKKCIDNKHLSYNGWTSGSTPTGQPIMLDEEGRRVKYPEFIESHVIVDFVEAFQVYPFWKPQFHDPMMYGDDGNWSMTQDKYDILDWKNNISTNEYVQSSDGVNLWLRKDYFTTDEFVKAYKAQLALGKAGREKKRMELREEDFVLLPKRLFAYVLRDRKFVPLDVRFLQFIQPQQNVFSRLKIIKEYKDIVKGLVASHFVKKDLERTFSALSTLGKMELVRSSSGLSEESMNQIATQGLTLDVIQGKGRGLVILLHGVPGVGKTATAEAVALEYRKPLFIITCGDFGLTPSDVEHHLNEVFRLAHLWDCVLLLDEADVFLAARNNLDLNRNALVSVFLRALEYYSGILFLTTNRVGTLDEAFKSRIHISLYYPALGKAQTKEIFKVNISRLDEIAKTRSKISQEPKLEIAEERILQFANNLFDNKKNEKWIPWNGRQIRNAFQIASSLAYHTMHAEYAKQLEMVERGEISQAEYPRPVLDETHFQVVAKVTDEFDHYMLETKGRTDSSRAQIYGERMDKIKAEQDLGMSRIGLRNGSDPFATNTTTFNRRDIPQTPEYPRSGGYQIPRAMSYGPPVANSDSQGRQLNPEQFGTPTTNYDWRAQAMPEEYRMKGCQGTQIYDNYMQQNRAPQSHDQSRAFRSDGFPQDLYTYNSAASHQDQQPRVFHQTPPHRAMSLQAETQFEQNGQTPSPAPQHSGCRTSIFNYDDPEAYD